MKKKYLLKKILQASVTLIIVLIFNYILFHIMPGDPLTMLIRNPKASPEAVEKLTVLFGLDKPWYIQFGLYFKQLFKGDLGMSFMFKKPVLEVIASKIMPTIVLVGIAEVFAIVIGIIIGVIAAWKRQTKIDVISLSFSLVTYSMPTFWLGIILVAIFSVYLGILPTSGMVTAGRIFSNSWAQIVDMGKHLVLPSLTLTLVLIGEYSLVMRSSLLDVLTEDYITTAKAKGFSDKWIIRKHALPNAMLPVVTIIAINLGFIIAGAIQIETVFSWPGIGRLMYEALKNRDYPLLQGIFLIISIGVIFANLFADILYSYLDPRVKS